MTTATSTAKSRKPAPSGALTKSPKETDVKIGQRIRVRRIQLGMSQEKLGASLGLTFQQIQKYEKGSNRVGGSRMAMLAETLQVPVSFFFGEGTEGMRTSDESVMLEMMGHKRHRALVAEYLKLPESVQVSVVNMLSALNASRSS